MQTFFLPACLRLLSPLQFPQDALCIYLMF